MIQNTLDVYRKFVDTHPNYEGVINLAYLPHERYKVDEVWKPKSKSCTIIAIFELSSPRLLSSPKSLLPA